MSLRALHYWFLVILGAAALLASVRVAGADETNGVDDRLAHVARMSEQRAQLDAQRKVLAHTYAERTNTIARLKAQPSSWSRDRKLEGLLRESQDMATALDKQDEQLQALDAQLAAEKKAVLAAIDVELASPPADATRAAMLSRTRSELAAELQRAHQLVIPDETIDPLDDPEDLDFKAGNLEQSERQLAAEEDRLASRAAYYHKQVKLAKARSRAEDQDVFHDDQPRRGTASTSDHSDKTTTGANGMPSPAVGGDLTDGAGTPSVPATPHVDTGADPSLVLANVVDPSTLDDLKKAEASGDPESRAKAAERAKADLDARIAKIHQRRLEMEQRAKSLRAP